MTWIQYQLPWELLFVITIFSHQFAMDEERFKHPPRSSHYQLCFAARESTAVEGPHSRCALRVSVVFSASQLPTAARAFEVLGRSHQGVRVSQRREGRGCWASFLTWLLPHKPVLSGRSSSTVYLASLGRVRGFWMDRPAWHNWPRDDDAASRWRWVKLQSSTSKFVSSWTKHDFFF